MGAGGIGGIAAIITSIVKARKENEDLESSIQNRIMSLAREALKDAEDRISRIEARAQAAEEQTIEAKQRSSDILREFESYKREAEYVLQRIYVAIETGTPQLIPPRPPWLPGWGPRNISDVNHTG